LSAFKNLVTENPMLVEMSRHKRRFLESGRGKGVNTMVLVVAMVAYLGLLMIVFNFSGEIPPDALVHLQTGVFAIIAPAILYGSIAGERDRRTWDLLLVAPITRRQIVAGKFIASLAGLAIGWALFLFPTMITAITYKSYGRPPYPIFGALLLQELVSISFGILACALTLFFSARAKRAFAALAMSLGTMFVLLVVVPIFAGILGVVDQFFYDATTFFHPMYIIGGMFAQPNNYGGTVVPPDYYFGVPQTLVYLFTSIALMEIASRTLTHADGDKRSILEASNA
jgi:ABC-type transport system involved in multi-copper enzyme maturation permease subunit